MQTKPSLHVHWGECKGIVEAQRKEIQSRINAGATRHRERWTDSGTHDKVLLFSRRREMEYRALAHESKQSVGVAPAFAPP